MSQRTAGCPGRLVEEHVEPRRSSEASGECWPRGIEVHGELFEEGDQYVQ